MTESEQQEMTYYIESQTAGNGVETTYDGYFARSWVDDTAANSFCDFAKTVLVEPLYPTTTQVILVA
jgi:hypothetical protein